MMKTIYRYLYKPEGRKWQYVRDVPTDVSAQYGKTNIRFSLKTNDATEARRLRDEYNAEYERTWNEIRLSQKTVRPLNLPGVRVPEVEAYHAGVHERGSDITPTLDSLANEIDELALDFMTPEEQRKGDCSVLDRAREEALVHTERGRVISRLLDQWKGNAFYTMLGLILFESAVEYAQSTKTEYRNALRLADQALPLPKRATREDVQLWVNMMAKRDADATIRKRITAINAALAQSGIENDAFQLSKLRIRSQKPKKIRERWTEGELSLLMRDCRFEWLRQAIIIAAYTGPREGVLQSMQYDPAASTLTYRKQKQEKEDRTIPCPDVIRDVVKHWVASPRAGSTIGSRFSELKQSVGFDKPEHENVKVFHALRKTALSKMIGNGVPEGIANKIAGHVPQSEVSKAYYWDLTVEEMEPYANVIHYAAFDPYL